MVRTFRCLAAALAAFGLSGAACACPLGDDPYQCSTRNVSSVNACSGLFKIDCLPDCPNLSRCTTGCSVVNAKVAVISGGVPTMVVSVHDCGEYSSKYDIHECDTAAACDECLSGTLLVANVLCTEPLPTTYVKNW